MQLFIAKILLVPSANAHQSPRNRQNGDAYHQKITADMMLFYRNIWVMYDEFGAKCQSRRIININKCHINAQLLIDDLTESNHTATLCGMMTCSKIIHTKLTRHVCCAFRNFA